MEFLAGGFLTLLFHCCILMDGANRVGDRFYQQQLGPSGYHNKEGNEEWRGTDEKKAQVIEV